MKRLFLDCYTAVAVLTLVAAGMLLMLGIDIYPSDLPYIFIGTILITIIAVIVRIGILIIEIKKEDND